MSRISGRNRSGDSGISDVQRNNSYNSNNSNQNSKVKINGQIINKGSYKGTNNENGSKFFQNDSII